MLPGRFQPSTFGTEGLNFCVRDGNRWDPFVIATGIGVALSFYGSSALSASRRRFLSAVSLSDRTLTTAQLLLDSDSIL